MTLIAGLDLGTSSVKLLVATPAGDAVARASASYGTVKGLVGEVEQRPEDWWTAAREVLAASGVADRISAIGVTGQMQDLIAVAGRRPLRNALLYSDTRAESQHARLSASFPEWPRRTENQQDVSNVAAKIAWLSEHEPSVLEEAEHLLFGAAGYLAWRAGGDAACDVTTASTTGLLDVPSRRWDAELLIAAGARLDQLPCLVSDAADAVVGEVDASAARELGVPVGIPIVVAMGDAVSTTDGLVGSQPGDAYLYLGTTGWLAAVTASAPDEPSPIHSLVLPGWEDRLRIGAVQSAGSAAEWALETFLPGAAFDDAEKLAAGRMAALASRPLCLPGIAGERTPVRDGRFRGAFVGVHESTEPVDFYLAVLTGVAFGLRHAADAMGVRQTRLPLVGGAASSSVWRQLLADVFDAEVVTRAAADPGAYSAVRAAVAALGWSSPGPLFHGDDAEEVVTSPSAAHPEYEALIPEHRALYDALAPSFHRLATQPAIRPR